MTELDMEWKKIYSQKAIRPEIREVRDSILNRVVAIFMLFGIIAAIPGIYAAYSQGDWIFAIFYSIAYLFFLISFLLSKWLPYTLRSSFLIIGILLFSITALSRLGLSGVGVELLILTCFIGSILFDIRIGLTLILVGIISIVIVGLGMMNGLIPVNVSTMMTSISALPWLITAIVFTLGTLVIVLSPQKLRNRLEKSLDLAEEQANILQTANRQLQEEAEKREQAEVDRTRLGQLLQSIIDSMPSILVTVDKNYCITLWNRRIADVLGVSEETAKGKPFTEYFPQLADKLPVIKLAMEKQQAQTIEKLSIQYEGETHIVDCLIYPISGDEEPGAVIKIDNVTERVRMEEMLIQSEKMMSVGGLAAGMAHEINNPLGGILQGIQNIERRLSPQMETNIQAAEKLGLNLNVVQTYLSERKIDEFILGIKDSGKRASTIISNMLLFSRKSESKIAEVNINDLLNNTIELAGNDYDLKKNFDFKHIEIVREYDPQMQTLWCTKTELEQVVLNLLKNAAQSFIEKNGHEKPRITIRTVADKEIATIEIEDNGPGMNEETRKRIFEPFYTTKPVGQGTGLGLAVSYMIITNNHKGRMEVQSKLDEGTRFSIHLPRIPDSSASTRNS